MPSALPPPESGPPAAPPRRWLARARRPPVPPVPEAAAPSTLPAPLGAPLLPAAAEAPVRSRHEGGVPVALAVAGLVLLASVLGAVLGAWIPAPWAAAAGAGLAALGLMFLLRLRAPDPGPPAFGLAGADGRVSGMSRAQFVEMAEREFARARRYGTGAALLLVDIDRHARILEQHGGPAAESLLQALLRHTAPTLRTADVLTRYTSTQMGVFLAHADATGALDVAERIRERAEQLEVPLAGAAEPAQPAAPAPLRFTVSIGVAHLRPAHLNLRAMADEADDAVLAARGAGGNCVRAAPVDPALVPGAGAWRGVERRARPFDRPSDNKL